MEKKKICFVTAVPRSAVAFLKTPISKLKDNFEIYYIGNFQDESETSSIGTHKVKAIPIERRLKPLKDIKAFWQLYKYFKKEKFFAVHAITRKASLLTVWAGFFARVPHRIKTFTGQVWATMKGPKRRFFMILDKLDVKLNTDLLVDGETQRQFLIKNKIMKESDAKVLANGSICGVDVERFKPNMIIREKRREELGYSNDDVVFIFLGRLKREKGAGELLQAFNDIARDFKNSKLLIVGAVEEDWKERIGNYPNIKEGENLVFYGLTKQPEELLQAGDIFVLPTYREGFGLSVLEASSVGLPVICSDTYGVMDAMVDNVTGLRCKTYDVESLKEAMIRLYEDSELRKKLGKQGRERVVNDFSRELVTQAWYDFYMDLK